MGSLRNRRGMRELSIVQPYVPRYRVAFFDGLERVLRDDDVRLRVIAGEPTKSQKARGDSATAEWLETVAPRIVEMGGRHLSLTYSRSLWRGSDAVIVPHQGSSLDAVSALARRGETRVGVWGHIASYTSPLNVVDGMVERWQLRRAHHVFAYTPGGAEFARNTGVSPRNITTVMNTIDSDELLRALDQLSVAGARAALSERGVPDAPYLAYIGGLDESKRIRFLAESLDIAHRGGIDVHIVVLGRGDQAELLGRAVARGQVTRLGYGGVTDKAAVLRGARAVVNPGRVGLLAVDCLAARTPLITTDWPWHAPELEYLRGGSLAQLVADDAGTFAETMGVAMRGAPSHPAEDWPHPPRLRDMVANFQRGVRSMLDG
ncbi:glycosyltransferase involved in cell wall biosynthesis [Microbacterium arborescens]|nr:glycosyltransferase involved in cell wall biosynthesis [Microbacterium arborescens]